MHFWTWLRLAISSNLVTFDNGIAKHQLCWGRRKDLAIWLGSLRTSAEIKLSSKHQPFFALSAPLLASTPGDRVRMGNENKRTWNQNPNTPKRQHAPNPDAGEGGTPRTGSTRGQQTPNPNAGKGGTPRWGGQGVWPPTLYYCKGCFYFYKAF